MAKERSKHQKNVIKNYYENKEAISLQKLSEMVTDLYLAEGKKRETMWNRVASALANLGVKPPQIKHLVEQDNPSLVADMVTELMNKQD